MQSPLCSVVWWWWREQSIDFEIRKTIVCGRKKDSSEARERLKREREVKKERVVA